LPSGLTFLTRLGNILQWLLLLVMHLAVLKCGLRILVKPLVAAFLCTDFCYMVFGAMSTKLILDTLIDDLLIQVKLFQVLQHIFKISRFYVNRVCINLLTALV
jgi:hypothetical protein